MNTAAIALRYSLARARDDMKMAARRVKRQAEFVAKDQLLLESHVNAALALITLAIEMVDGVAANPVAPRLDLQEPG